MRKYVIATGTVTRAIKCRDILRQNGFSAEMERMKELTEDYGCGYAVTVAGNPEKIRKILSENRIDYLKMFMHS